MVVGKRVGMVVEVEGVLVVLVEVDELHMTIVDKLVDMVEEEVLQVLVLQEVLVGLLVRLVQLVLSIHLVL